MDGRSCQVGYPTCQQEVEPSHPTTLVTKLISLRTMKKVMLNPKYLIPMTVASGHVLGCNSYKDHALRHSKPNKILNPKYLIPMTVASGDVLGCNSHKDQALRLSGCPAVRLSGCPADRLTG